MRGTSRVLLIVLVLMVITAVGLVIVGPMVKAHGQLAPQNDNTTFPNQSGTLAPALCCHQFGEGNNWGDERK